MNQQCVILLVEDSATQALEYSYHLRAHGFSVLRAEDGITALTMTDEYRPQAIVLDVNLPGMDGFQVCRRLKRDPELHHIPIVMLTVADSADDTLLGLESGADDYIPKDSFAPQNLITTLNAILSIENNEGG